MNDPGVTETRSDRLRNLLDRLKSSELKLADAEALRAEVLRLVSAGIAGCDPS